MTYVYLVFFWLIPLLVTGSPSFDTADGAMNEPIPVEIVRNDDGSFQLLRGGEPYFVKGAVAIDRHLDVLADAGGNSVRSRAKDRAFLDKLESLGLSIMFNLPVHAQRNGMNYDDPVAVRQQFDEVMAEVRAYKDHPAVLFWSLGNELDHVPGNSEATNWNVYDALNDLAVAIHEEDPNHPVMTVVGTGQRHKLGELVERAPALDLIGVNSYGDIGEVREWIDTYEWNRPYVFTEWGPTGAWQVEKTSWGRPIEETEAEKAEVRMRRYREAVLDNRDVVLGAYVFHWWSRQETTHTWYGMFDEGGRASESVDAMQYVWTGEWPQNRSPHLIELTIEGEGAGDDVTLELGKEYSAEAVVRDPDGDKLEYDWELVSEPEEYGAYAGSGEIRQPAIPRTIPSFHNSPQIIFKTPEEAGEYRLFMYAYDGNDHFTAANIPILVK